MDTTLTQDALDLQAEHDRLHARRWWTLAILCLSLTVISVDNTILNVALPSIVKHLSASGAQLQWIIDSYTIVFACLLLTTGSLGDRFGRKRILTVGLVLFGTCSAFAAFSGSAVGLIACRALMGIGGACIFPSTLSILTNTFSGDERARAIGIWAGVSGLGIAVGPLLGGFLLEHFWWGSVFLINAPICVAAIVLGRFCIPESKHSEEASFDPLGAVLSVAGLFGLLYGIIEVPDKGWGHSSVLVGFAAGAVFLTAFALWETSIEKPMLDVRFFKNPRFTAASATLTLTSFALYGSTFLLTQYFQFVRLYSPLKAGVLTAPVAVGLMVTAPQAPKLVRHWGTKWVVVLGLGIVSTGLVLYSSDTLMKSFAVGLLVRGLFGVGFGFTMAPATESIMGSLPPGRAGVGSAVNDTTRQAGGALGVAVVGSVFASRYHSVIADKLPAVPAAAREATRDSIGRALERASQLGLPPDQAAAVHRAASEAYVSASRFAYPLAALVVAMAAVLAWRFLPSHAPSADEPDGAEASAHSGEIRPMPPTLREIPA